MLFSSIPDDSVIITDNYLDKQYVNYKLFIDFPEKAITHLEISSEAEDIRREIFHKIFWKIRTTRELQKRLFPDTFLQLSPDRMEALFRHDPALQHKLLAHVYLISPKTKEVIAKQGIAIGAIYLRPPGVRQKFTFHRVFLMSPPSSS